MEDNVEIWEDRESAWLTITDGDQVILDNKLDEILNRFHNYSLLSVICEDNNESKNFYDYIADYPRVDQFLEKETEATAKAIEDGIKNPVIRQKFLRHMVSKLVGATPDEIEEFLEHRQSQKSARKQ